ncbi:MAG: 50S ribosomal protein L18 [Cellvibrionales bacterium]|nr:50S ribosomal protein L18 [Cellvibrionales bacterium]
MDKKTSRLRRAKRSRIKLRELGAIRLTVTRSSQHMYAQVISADGGKVLAQASTLDKAITAGTKSNIAAAQEVGKLIAERAKGAGIEAVSFDRSGYKYHGRVKALADSAREAGLKI